MARTVVGYIPRGFLNNAASSVSTGAVDTESGLPLPQGLGVGQFQEFSDGEALSFSTKGVSSIIILTAGSGMTPGTYTALASAGTATISIVVAAGGTVTAIPTVTVPGGPYTDAAIPTFTMPTAAGGTGATFQAVIGVLYSGVYRWVQLDPAVTGTIAVGTALYWLQSNAGQVVTTTVSANSPDFAGFSIDPNFGAALPYAFIQQNGKVRAVFASSLTNGGTKAYGDHIALTTSSSALQTTVDDISAVSATTAIAPNAYLGYALVVPAVNATSLIRVLRYPSRY